MNSRLLTSVFFLLIFGGVCGGASYLLKFRSDAEKNLARKSGFHRTSILWPSDCEYVARFRDSDVDSKPPSEICAAISSPKTSSAFLKFSEKR
uniref:Uncharacterized protein n=1 Tax=Leptospira ellisii TaxID=2023197 RepID=A0A2N0BCW7_9LEPT|nr:hypothetical protein CH379_02720 [Leptospira ellisii]